MCLDNIIVSVIIPVYNVKDYIDRAMKSIVSQTYSNLEIIMIDDGSTDGSSSICDAWKDKDSRVKVIHTDNCGVSHARNCGIDIATGKYVTFVDADDWIENDMYEKMLSVIEDDNTDICISGFVKCDDKNDYNVFAKTEHKIMNNMEALYITFNKCGKRYWGWELWDKLFKKELFDDIRLKEGISNFEDGLVVWQLMKKSSKISFYPLYKYHYYIRANSAVHTISLDAIKGINTCYNYMINDNTVTDDVSKIIMNGYYSFLINRSITLYEINQKNSDIFKDFLYKIKSNVFKILMSDVGIKNKIKAICLIMFPGIIKYMRYMYNRK